MVWNGVGFGLLGNGNEAAMKGSDMGMKEKEIGRVWQGIEKG